MTNIVPRGRPTGPTQQQANAFIGAELAVQPTALQRTKRGGVAFADDTSNFPASQYPDSALEDTMMVSKSQVVGGQNITGAPVPVHYTLGPDDFEYFRSKQAAEEMANYERWVALQFDFKSPADVDRFAKMFPEYFERRMAVLKNVSDANLRYAQILLTGAQSADDYVYLWMAQTGRIPLITGPLWKPDSWFDVGSAAEARMAMFNPLKLFATARPTTMPTPYIPNANTGFFNPGIPLPATAARSADRNTIQGFTPNPAAGGAPFPPWEVGVPENFSMRAGAAYRGGFM